MFHILAVSGSPRKGGNTEILVNTALAPFIEEGHEVQRFFMSERKVAPCIACDACEEDGVCVIKDDMEGFMEELSRCDGMIIGSPVYSRNISGQLLALFNRMHCVTHRRLFRDRICFGGAIAVGGSPNSEGITLTIIHNFLLSLGVCAVPGLLNGVSVVARKKGEVSSQPKSLSDARILGGNILRVLKKAKGAA